MKQIKFLVLTFIFFNLCFSINSVYVSDIIFKGNAKIKSIELANLLRLQEKTLFTTTEFKSNKLNLDLITLQTYYKSNGYLDVKIDYSYNYIDDYNISILFIISEGVQYKVNNVSIMGNKSFKDEYILNLINLNSENYNPIYIRNKLIDLKEEYLRIGKINIFINESITKYDSLIDLQIDISEGKIFVVNDITFSGLENIDKKLVLRELIFNKGDIYNITRINESKTHLFESQLFSSIEIFPYIESDTTIILDVRLRELQRREIEFQMGIGQLPSNKGDLPISAINISGSISRGNLFATATKASFKAEFGLSYLDNNTFYRSYYELGLHSPWFINVRIPFRLKIYSQNILFDKFALGDTKLGIIAYIENYRSSNPYLSSGLITEFFESENNRSIYISYIKHNIDDFINPKRGYYISINPRLNGTLLGGEYNYLKVDVEFKSFKSIFNNIVYAFRFKTGFIHPISYTDNESGIPEFDKFFLGGSSSLRGWASPLEYNDETGGLSRILVNSEIRIPLYKMIGLEFFYDAGSLGLPDAENNFNWNIGWGITVLSSLGPMRVDFAFKEGIGRSTVQLSLLNMF